MLVSTHCRIFDTDNNGVISVDELKNIVEHLFHLVPEGQKHHLETPASVGSLSFLVIE